MPVSPCSGTGSVAEKIGTRAIRRVWYRSTIALTLLISINLAVPARAEPKTFNDGRWPFLVTARKLCPDSHLEFLNTAAVDGLFENYLDGLPSKVRSRFEKSVQARCRDILNGRVLSNLMSCQNAAYMQTVSKLKLTSTFGAFACRTEVVCKDNYECSDGKWIAFHSKSNAAANPGAR